MIRKIFKFLFFILLTIILLFTVFLGWQSINEFKPPKEQILASNFPADLIPDSITIISWNIGYFGLGAEMDFFYEGGKLVRPEKETYQKYRNACLERLTTFDTADFVFLQEIDTGSKRSWYENQMDLVSEVLPSYRGYFGINYNAWVPVPPTGPMGKVRAGLATFSNFVPVSAERVSFESSYDWPMRLFQLKRCFVKSTYNTIDGKQLILVNTHNSAFSDAAELREKELNTLKSLMLDEYKKGNYIIVGGDWNQNPPAFDSTQLLPIYKSKHIRPGIPSDFIPQGWTYAYDPLHTTNRDVNIPYREGETVSTLIDFFILSPNVELLSVKTIPTGYKESDHQPVVLNVAL